MSEMGRSACRRLPSGVQRPDFSSQPIGRATDKGCAARRSLVPPGQQAKRRLATQATRAKLSPPIEELSLAACVAGNQNRGCVLQAAASTRG